MILSLTACATTGRDLNYQAYIAAASKPLVEVKVDPDSGKVLGFVVGNPFLQQQAEHPAWRVAEKVVGVAGIVGGVWVAGQAVGNIASEIGKNAGHNVTLTNGAGNLSTGGGKAGNYSSVSTSTPAESGGAPSTPSVTSTTNNTNILKNSGSGNIGMGNSGSVGNSTVIPTTVTNSYNPISTTGATSPIH
jgi:hypothetical protein